MQHILVLILSLGRHEVAQRRRSNLAEGLEDVFQGAKKPGVGGNTASAFLDNYFEGIILVDLIMELNIETYLSLNGFNVAAFTR